MMKELSAAEVLAGSFHGVERNVLARAISAPIPKEVMKASKAADLCNAHQAPCTELAATAAGTLLGPQAETARMSHKQVEQHRRMKAKQYFDELRCLVPGGVDPKCDRNRLLQIAIEHIKNLRAGKDVTYKAAAAGSPSPEAPNRHSDDHSVMIFEMDTDGKERLSHNEVEQRRRLQAKQLYEDLRRLLPHAAKLDKNAVLYTAIRVIQQLSGVSDEALARRLRDYTDNNSDADSDGGGGARGGLRGSGGADGGAARRGGRPGAVGVPL